MPAIIDASVHDDTIHAVLAEARSDDPIAVDEHTGACVVLRYRDVEALAHDHRLVGVGLSFFDFMGIGDTELRRWFGSLMFTNEGEYHHRLRRLVAKAFTPRAVERHRQLARDLASARLHDLLDHGEGDLTQALADVPMLVMCRLLGIPDDEGPAFLDYGDALSPVFGFMEDDQIATAERAVTELCDDVDRVVANCDGDQDDLISALLAVEDGGDRLSHDELVTIVGNLLVGGHDTTASQIGCSLLTLLRNPATDARATSPVSDVVAETIRFEPSIGVVPRTAVEPVAIGGTEWPAGSMVFLSTLSANRDEQVWDRPELVRPDRFAESSTPKLLSFGSGAHYCLGAALAKMTLEEVVDGFTAIASRLQPEFETEEIAWRLVLGRSPARLPVSVI